MGICALRTAVLGIAWPGSPFSIDRGRINPEQNRGLGEIAVTRSDAELNMPSGPNQLNYNLYQFAAHTTIWGDGASGTSPVVQALPPGMGGMGGMGMGFNMNHTVYGRSFASQDPPPGAYADIPIVTIEF